jgi:hypothetical protein
VQLLSHLKKSKEEVCPYCRSAIPKDESVACVLCHTHHHIDCWNEAGRCAVYGCREAEFTPSTVWLFKCFAIAVVVVLSSELLTKFWNGNKAGLFGFTFIMSFILFSLTSGYTYSRSGIVIRKNDPLGYWGMLLLYAFIAFVTFFIMLE